MIHIFLLLIYAITGAAQNSQPQIRKVVGGIDSAVVFPFFAELNIVKSNGSYLCGGTLIHPKVILTAAHCIQDATSVTAIFGRRVRSDTTTGEEVSVAGWGIHEQYEDRTTQLSRYENDIAILVLDQERPKEHVAKIPMSFASGIEQLESGEGIILGFGRLYEGGPTADALQIAQIPMQSQDICRAQYTGLYGIDIPSTAMCAGELVGGVGTCQGDSGGPLLVYRDSGTFQGFWVVGIVSYGIICAAALQPTVFTRVRSYWDWITTRLATLDPSVLGMVSQAEYDIATAQYRALGQIDVLSYPQSFGLFTTATLLLAESQARIQGQSDVINDPFPFNLVSVVEMDYRTALALSIGYSHGISSVLAVPSDYGLTSQGALEQAFHDGQNRVILNPESYGLIPANFHASEILRVQEETRQEAVPTSEVLSNLSPGWHPFFIPESIAQDATRYEDMQVVWNLQNGVWKFYTSDQSSQESLLNAGYQEIAETVHGILWVKR